MCELNREYADKRKSGRLRPLSIGVLQSGTFQTFRSDWVAKGRREAQFKIVAVQHRWELEFDFEAYVTSESPESGAAGSPGELTTEQVDKLQSNLM